jgi:hypothetical protein
MTLEWRPCASRNGDINLWRKGGNNYLRDLVGYVRPIPGNGWIVFRRGSGVQLIHLSSLEEAKAYLLLEARMS